MAAGRLLSRVPGAFKIVGGRLRGPHVSPRMSVRNNRRAILKGSEMKNRGYVAFGLLGLIWGSNFIFTKWAVHVIEPTQVVFLRILLGFLPILGFALWRGELKRDHLRHWFHFLVMSLLATTLYYYAFAKGTSLLRSSVAGMLSGAIPLFAFVTAFIFLREDRLTVRKAMGVLLGFGGVLLIARPWTIGSSDVNLAGVLYMVAGSLSLGCSFVYARKFLSRLNISALALSTYQIGLALVSISLVTKFSGMSRIAFDMRALLGLVLGLGLVGTGVAYILYYYLVQKLGAVSASAVTYIPPVVALVIGYAAAGEPVSLLDLVAMACILGGVYALQSTARPSVLVRGRRS